MKELEGILNSSLKKTPVAMPFKVHNPRNDKVKEFNVFFNQEKNSFDKFLEFIDLYRDMRINIVFRGDFPMNIATSVQKVSNNTYIKLLPEQINSYPQSHLKTKFRGLPVQICPDFPPAEPR